MRIDMSMSREEEKFSAASWWATTPAFVIHTLKSQLRAAAVIWPELAAWDVGTLAPPPSGESVETKYIEKKDE